MTAARCAYRRWRSRCRRGWRYETSFWLLGKSCAAYPKHERWSAFLGNISDRIASGRWRP